MLGSSAEILSSACDGSPTSDGDNPLLMITSLALDVAPLSRNNSKLKPQMAPSTLLLLSGFLQIRPQASSVEITTLILGWSAIRWMPFLIYGGPV